MTSISPVVLDTTKVLIFKQITTTKKMMYTYLSCFRYHKGTDFQANHNKKGATLNVVASCFRYHKGTDFQANHNRDSIIFPKTDVVLDTTKVLIFKQITTICCIYPERICCFRYHKGTDFQANHNSYS